MNTSNSRINIDPVNFLVTTTPTVEGYCITKTLDVVTAECVFGLNIFKDLFAGLSDFFGGRSNTTQNALRDARRTCLNELRREAALLGANAVIGVDLDYSEFSGQGKSMLFLVASGTAVIIEPAIRHSARLSRPDSLGLQNPQCRLYLAEKYQIHRHEILGEYVAGNQLFSSVEQALEAVQKLEIADIERERLRREEITLLENERQQLFQGENDLSEADVAMMAEYNIEHDSTHFIFQTYRYEKLADAISYAKKSR